MADILSQAGIVASHAFARSSTPTVLHQEIDVGVIFDKAKIFGHAVFWERCRRRLTYRQHHTGMQEAIAVCSKHSCGISRNELAQVRKIDFQFLEFLERGTLSLAQALELLTSCQCLFIIKGLGFSDEDVTPSKMERFLLQRGDWWV